MLCGNRQGGAGAFFWKIRVKWVFRMSIRLVQNVNLKQRKKIRPSKMIHFLSVYFSWNAGRASLKRGIVKFYQTQLTHQIESATIFLTPNMLFILYRITHIKRFCMFRSLSKPVFSGISTPQRTRSPDSDYQSQPSHLSDLLLAAG